MQEQTLAELNKSFHHPTFIELFEHKAIFGTPHSGGKPDKTGSPSFLNLTYIE